MGVKLPLLGAFERNLPGSYTTERDANSYAAKFRLFHDKGFRAMGLHTPQVIAEGAVAAFRKAATVPVYMVGNGASTLDAPTFGKTRPKLHAAACVDATRALHAAACGMDSYTLSPPEDRITGTDLESYVSAVLDLVDEGGGGRIRLMNGATPKHWLRRPEQLLDYAKNAGLDVGLNLGYLGHNNCSPTSSEGWEELLKQCPKDVLFVYGNAETYRQALGWHAYKSDQDALAIPPLRPFLEALKTKKLTPPVLVVGPSHYYDANNAITTMCKVYGVDQADLCLAAPDAKPKGAVEAEGEDLVYP